MRNNNKLKVLNIIQGYHPVKGGAELFMKVLSEYQVKKLGYDVDVWTTDVLRPDQYWNIKNIEIDKKEEVINGVNVKRFPIGKGILKYKFLNKCFSIILSRFPNFTISNLASTPTTFGMLDVVNSGRLKNYDFVTVSAAPYYFLFYVGYLVSKKMNIPYIIAPAIHIGVSKDDFLRKKYLKRTSIPFYQHASKIILNTKAEGEAVLNFCKSYGVSLDPSKFVVIGQGVFIDEVTSGDGESFRKRYHLDYPIVFQVGSKNEDKGSFNLVDAMKTVWDSGTKCHLVFGGQYSDDFSLYIEGLENKYKKWILNIDNISDEEKWDLFAAGDVFSMVSKTDSFGIVYLEAWSNGIPVLGCNNEAIKQVIDNDKDGYLLNFDDVKGISEKVRILLMDKKLRKEMGEAGKKKVGSKYNWEKNLKKLGEIYKI